MTIVLGEDELRRVATEAIRSTKGDGAEALVVVRTPELTRFANNLVHQSVSSRDVTLQIRVTRGKRIGMYTTSDISSGGIARAAREASELAAAALENANFVGLPPAQPIQPAPSAFNERTSAATAQERAAVVGEVISLARSRRLTAAGYLLTSVQEVAVASTTGVWAYAPQTLAALETVIIGEAGSGWAERSSTDIARIDVGAVAHEAADKCGIAQHPRDLPAGDYEVVLEPYAVVDMIGLLSGSLNGSAVEEGKSFVGGRLGQKVTGPITLVDDPFDPDGVPRAFDFEGQPTRKVTLIERGVARAVVYDHQTAFRTSNTPTGHALPANPYQPAAPMHVRFEPGSLSHEELIRGVKRGLLVTRFHIRRTLAPKVFVYNIYSRWIHQLKTITASMTRDGTFAIIDGEISHPVRNLRFVQSYGDAFEGTLGIGRDLHLFAAGEYGIQTSAYRVPAIRLASFSFTGTA